MDTLIAFYDDNRAKQNHVKGVISKGGYKRVILLKPKDTIIQNNLPDHEEILFNKLIPTNEITELFEKSLNVQDFEVHINIICGEGKEHTALLSALIKKGIGIRFVVLIEEGILEL